MNNYDYFEYSKSNPEEMFDPFYKKGVVVIPADSSKQNRLTINNNRMIECITAFSVILSKNYTINDQPVVDIVNEIVNILSTTPGINYSAFSQFFMVYNSTYSNFQELKHDEKIEFIYEMLIKYCQERHGMYLSHGYTDSILQVMSDNYSHKRNGKTSIQKVLSILKPYNLTRIHDINETDGDDYYFLPDKGDAKMFDQFILKYNLKMESRAIEQSKYPDVVFKHNGQVYICELKTMKGSGGGQNKQIVELAYFIAFAEKNKKFHYIAFLDGDYANILFSSKMPKVKKQRDDISNALKKNRRNYFVNTAGFERLVLDLFK